MRFHLHLRFLSPIRRAEVLAELQRAATPGFDFFLLVVLSCSVASFGLIIDSPAVIIGAMLIAPLMSPILGLSLASVAGERKLFQHAVLALAEGAALAVMLAASWGGVRVKCLSIFCWKFLRKCWRARTRRPWICLSRWRGAQRRPIVWRNQTFLQRCRASPLPPPSCHHFAPWAWGWLWAIPK